MVKFREFQVTKEMVLVQKTQAAKFNHDCQLELLESPKWMSVAVGKAEVVFSLPRHGVSLIQFGW